MAVQSGSPLVEALYSISTQTLCVVGVAVGCHHSLKRWMAISSLTPPEAPKAGSEVKKRSKYLFGAIFTTILVLFLAFEFGLVYGISQIKSEQWLNIVWGVIEGLLIAVFTFTGTLLLCPVEQSFSLVHHKVIPAKYDLKQNSKPFHWSRFVASIGAALTCLYLSSQGIRAMQPVVVAGWVMSSIGLQQYQTISVKWATIFINAYIFGVPIIGLVLGFVIEACVKAFGSSESSNTNTEPSPELHPWMARMMLMMGSGVPALVPSILTTLALRFDYAQTRSGIALRAEPGQAVAMPTTTPIFPKPMFTTALAALVGSLAIGEIISSCFLDPQHIGEFAWLILTIPIVSVALLGRAWSLGKLKQWWMYREVWVPTKEDINKPIGDVEAVPVESESEKAGLLTAQNP